MKKFRLGVVGLGHRGRGMFKGVAKGIGGFEAVAACDLNPALWFEPTNSYYGGTQPALAECMPDVAFFESYDDMIEKAGLDVVLVETPADCHAEFCGKALKKGLHVFSDIPTVRTLEEAAMLWDVQKDAAGMLMTGATTCGWGFGLALQDLYRQGLLGRPYFLEAEYIHDCRGLWEETPWRKPTKKWGSMPIRYCTHSLGPLLSVMEEDLRTVSCVSTGSHVTELEYANDHMTAQFQTESGVTVRFAASFINNASCGNHSYRVFGTEGYFEHLSHRGKQHPERTMFNSNRLYGASGLTELPVGFSPYESAAGRKYNLKEPFGHGGADSYLWQLFAEALRTGAKEAPIPLREGLRMTLPGIYAAESAIRGGERLTIHYPWERDFAGDIRAFRQE